MIDIFDELIIKNYFSLLEIHSKLLNYLKNVKAAFYLQTMTTHIEYGELGIFTKGFRPDREVEKIYTCLEVIDRRIERNEYRNKHFNRYLSNLSEEESQALELKYMYGKEQIISEQVQNNLLDEITEIETAICYRSNMEPNTDELDFELNEDVDENLERMCDFFAL